MVKQHQSMVGETRSSILVYSTQVFLQSLPLAKINRKDHRRAGSPAPIPYRPNLLRGLRIRTRKRDHPRLVLTLLAKRKNMTSSDMPDQCLPCRSLSLARTSGTSDGAPVDQTPFSRAFCESVETSRESITLLTQERAYRWPPIGNRLDQGKQCWLSEAEV
jgi:hypothetical protein